LGNAVHLSISSALRKNGCRVLYFAGYRKTEDLFKQTEIEQATDQVIWSIDRGEPIPARRPQDKQFVGNIVQSMEAYASGKLGPPMFPFSQVDRIIVIGSDRMMAAVAGARYTTLKPYLKENHLAIASINSPMQCMMKEVCAQCLQKHIDPKTGREEFVFTCYNQDQLADSVDWANLNERLKMNSVAEKLAARHLDYLLKRAETERI
jgi:NAD(P)H-flavin reductase